MHIQGIMSTAGGAVVLKRWCKMWISASVSASTAELWTVAVICPVDCGETLDDQGQLKRKLRPIALAETLLKFAEGLAVDAALPRLTGAWQRQMEPPLSFVLSDLGLRILLHLRRILVSPRERMAPHPARMLLWDLI